MGHVRGEGRRAQLGEQWLSEILEILSRAGIASGEEYASAPSRSISRPVAAVGLRGLDWGAGKATFSVRILSPRCRGGWLCQTTAAKAVAALEEARVQARMEPMEYLEGCDCFEVLVIGIRRVRELPPVPPEPPEEKGWQVLLGGKPVAFAAEFEEEQNRRRRLLGATAQEAPVGITPGTGGWSIRLVLHIPAGQPEPALPAEPFELKLVRENTVITYSGCCWNQTARRFGERNLTVELQGLALQRKEESRGADQI